MQELTPRLLHIPHVVAARYAMPGTQAHDELMSAGYVGLVKAAKLWRNDGGASLETYAFRAVINCILREINVSNKSSHTFRWSKEKLTSIHLFTNEGEDLSFEESESGTGGNDDAVEYVLKQMTTEVRTVYVLTKAYNMPTREIAKRLGINKGRVHYLMAQAVLQVKKAVLHLRRTKSKRKEKMAR